MAKEVTPRRRRRPTAGARSKGRRVVVACAISGAIAVALAAGACRQGTWDGRAHTPSLTSVASDAGPSVTPRSPRELPAVAVAYDDPRLAGARDRERAKDYAGAIQIVEDARRAHAAEPSASCAWAYVAGRLHTEANEHPEAAAAFDQVRPDCPVVGYARLRAAQEHARAGHWEESLARARAVPATIAAYDEAKIALAEAMVARGDRRSAASVWRDLLTEAPHGTRWVDTAVRLASAILDGEAPPGAPGGPEAAREAFDLVTRVYVEAPKYADASGATELRKRAAAALHARDPAFTDALSEADLARRLQAWLDAGEATHARDEANAAIAGWPVSGHGGTAPCKIMIARAQALARNRKDAPDAWGDAIRTCAGDDLLVSALYQGGKSSVAANRTQEATDRFARVEREFPKHRLADDSRLLAALALKDTGDEGKFTTMLLALPDDYPEGDMRGEALFRVALARMTKGDWAGAKEPLDRALALEAADPKGGGTSVTTAGRAAYFRARVAQATGEVDDAKQGWIRVLDEHPLSFYMLEAYARLAAVDEAAAGRALDAAVAREHDGPVVTKDHPELTTPGFDLAVHLLEVGEVDAARRELAHAGVGSEGADPELLWILGDLYDRAGAPELGHAFARGRLTEHLAHYPAGTWRFAWEVAFPRAFEPLVRKECQTTGLPVSLTWGIMREESAFWPEAKSKSNAFGLMQLIVSTARGAAHGTELPFDENGLKRPDVNVALGTRVLAGLRSSFPGNPVLPIAGYNAGGGAVGRWVAKHPGEDTDLFVEEIPFEETRSYVKKVLASETAYAWLYDRPSLKEVLALPPRVSP